MRKIHLLLLIFVISTVASGQTSTTHTFNVTSLSFGTDSQAIHSGLGTFNLSGTDANGQPFTRTSINSSGTFWGNVFNCYPCNKRTSSFGGFIPGRWLTAGGAQTPNEWTFLELQVQVPNWSMRTSIPKRRNLTKRLPVTMNGTIRIRDARNTNNIIEYIDNDVRLEGTMSAEFLQYPGVDATLLQWRKLDISVSAPNN
jgi:hypothetical protein